jgi:hypothetical protein
MNRKWLWVCTIALSVALFACLTQAFSFQAAAGKVQVAGACYIQPQPEADGSARAQSVDSFVSCQIARLTELNNLLWFTFFALLSAVITCALCVCWFRVVPENCLSSLTG